MPSLWPKHNKVPFSFVFLFFLNYSTTVNKYLYFPINQDSPISSGVGWVFSCLSTPPQQMLNTEARPLKYRPANVPDVYGICRLAVQSYLSPGAVPHSKATWILQFSPHKYASVFSGRFQGTAAQLSSSSSFSPYDDSRFIILKKHKRGKERRRTTTWVDLEWRQPCEMSVPADKVQEYCWQLGQKTGGVQSVFISLDLNQRLEWMDWLGQLALNCLSECKFSSCH